MAMSYDLCTATSVGDLNCVKEYLELPFYLSSINSSNHGGWTSLMYAAYYGHADLLEMLLKNGADVNLRNNHQQTSLMLSSMCGNDNCCSVLLKNRARIDDRDENSWTSLVYAVSAGYPSVVKLLIQKGADVNVVIEKDKMTPFLIAAASGHEQVLRLLSENGANQYVKSSSGKSASVLALENGHTHLYKFFESGSSSSSAFTFQQNDFVANKNLQVARETAFSPQTPPISPFHLEPPFPKDLKSLLSLLGLSEYVELFQKRNIDLNKFLKLNGESLKELGVNKLGPRCKMNSAITRINAYGIPPETFEENTVKNTEITTPDSLLKSKPNEDQIISNLISREQLSFILGPLLSLQLKTEHLGRTVSSLKDKVVQTGYKKDAKISVSQILGDVEETDRLSINIQESLALILNQLSDSVKISDQ